MTVTDQVKILEWKAELYDARQAVAQARGRAAMANRYGWSDEKRAEAKDALAVAQKMLAGLKTTKVQLPAVS